MARPRTRKWTQAHAARTARDARIATATHLADAPIASTWHATKLVAGYRHQLAHVENDKQVAAALLFGGMGYEPPFPQDWNAAAERVVADEAQHLAAAELFIMSPQICDVVIAAAQALEPDDLELLDAEDLPAPSGLLVLPHPVLIQTTAATIADMKAIAWHTPATVWGATRDGAAIRHHPAVRVSSYDDTHGPVQPDSFLDLARTAREQGTPLPPLLLDAVRCYAFRYQATDEQRRSRDEFLARLQRNRDATRMVQQVHGVDENRVVGEYEPDSIVEDTTDSFTIRMLYAFWRLCAQRIAVAADVETNHAARLQADRSGMPADVRVIQLRRTNRKIDQGPASKNWQHRWIVRMHKVRQWYPSLQQHKVIYRGPYPKGPDDKPLLRGDKVHGLVR
ncbi:hypothetical protein [Actinomadura sp. 3N407]|uniref:hypothetical protein n=1 Tax=Actinomadura sp. 3N407 TaxID=3457423 RepID=UPI003FCDBEFE